MANCNKGSWYSNIYVWIVIVITALIVWLSVSYSRFMSPSYENAEKPVGMVPPWVFSLVWTVLYIGILLAVIFAVWKTNSSPLGLTILYATIMLYTFGWVFSFAKLEDSYTSLIFMLILLFLVFVMIMATNANSIDSSNSVIRHFPSIMFSMFAVWLLIATYYNTGFVALNEPLANVNKP